MIAATRCSGDICELDWKLQDVVVAVVRELDDAPEDVLVRPG